MPEQGKLSPRLEAELAARAPGDPVDVVIALAAPDVPAASAPAGRADAIAALKASFALRAESVTQTLTAAGGELLDSAWVNSTLRGRLPADRVGELAADEHVEGIDLPVRLEPEG